MASSECTHSWSKSEGKGHMEIDFKNCAMIYLWKIIMFVLPQIIDKTV